MIHIFVASPYSPTVQFHSYYTDIEAWKTLVYQHTPQLPMINYETGTYMRHAAHARVSDVSNITEWILSYSLDHDKKSRNSFAGDPV